METAMNEAYQRAEETGAKAMAIFKEKIRPTLTEADKGKYLVIDTRTGEFVKGNEPEEVRDKANIAFGRGPFRFMLRAGYRSVYSFRPGLDLELKEW